MRSIVLLVFCLGLLNVTYSQQPNILIIIADDLGVDMMPQYHFTGLKPTTPTLDSLVANGLLFENVWSAPSCTPTRATIMSGKYGNKTGVLDAPGHLDTAHASLFKHLDYYTNGAYNDAVVGKWHISMPQDPLHPMDHEVDHYMGLLGSGWPAYDNWDSTYNGNTTTSNNYATLQFTHNAIEWINNQNGPWITWLAHIAPHSPYHLPPDSMYTLANTGSIFRQYVTMIESLDFEVNRLLKAIPDNVEQNTVIFFVGDNGTPNNFIQEYPPNRGKGTLYQGGIRVPLFVSGAGVTRVGEREAALTHVNDIHATALELAGANLPGGIFNSFSFKHLLSNPNGPRSPYVYSEVTSVDFDGCAIRDERFKMIKFANGDIELYDLLDDSLELNNLMLQPLAPDAQTALLDLEAEASQIKNAWSCQDLIQNGDETGIDCGGTYCQPCTSGLFEFELASIRVFPNPANEHLFVKGVVEDYQVKDAYGRVMGIYSKSQQSINVESWPAGLYFLQSGHQRVKFLKQ